MKPKPLIAVSIGLLFMMGTTAHAGGSRSTALVVVGLGGDKAHYEALVGSATTIATGLRQKFGYGDRLVLLTEDGPGKTGVDGVSDSAGIRSAIMRFSKEAMEEDRLLLVLIGHSSGEREYWRLNIPGGDLSATDWRDILSSYPGPAGIVVAAPAAANLSKVLAGPKRMIISSTRLAEIRTWAFLDALAGILGPSEEMVERPKTLWDLFKIAEKGVERAFKEKGYMRNEHASLEDNGDGLGTESSAQPGGDGKLARTFILRGDAVGKMSATPIRKNSTFTDSEIFLAAAKTPDPPGFDAVVLLHEQDININEDLTTRGRTRTVTKLITEAGRERANVDITFPPGVDADISHARTLLPDGRVIDADTHALLKAMLIEDEPEEVPGVETPKQRRFLFHLSEAVPGAILDIEVTARRRNFDIRGDFFDDIILQRDIPVRRASVTVQYPKTLDLKFIPAGLPGKPATKNASRYAKTMTYQADNLGAVSNEPLSDPPYLRAGRLVLTSIQTWDEIARWYYFLSKPVFRSDTEIKNLANRLTDGLAGDNEKVKALYEWVSEEIRYVAIPLGVHGYKPHMVPNILKWRYGDCKDKASLLITLMREAGLRAHIVLIGAGMGNVVPDAPRPSAFNHAILALPGPGGIQFLDPTAENAMYGTLPPMDQGRHALIVWGETGTLELTPFDPPESNALHIDRTAGIVGDDLAVSETRASTGRWALDRRSLLRREGLSNTRGAVAAELGRRINGVRLEDYEARDIESINRPLIEFLRYRIIGGGRGALFLPWEPTPLAGISTDEIRKTDVSLGTTLMLSEIVSVAGVKSPESKTEVKNNLGEAKVETLLTANGVQIHRLLRLTVPRAPASDYPALVALAGVVPAGISREVSIHLNTRLLVAVSAIAILGFILAGALFLKNHPRQ